MSTCYRGNTYTLFSAPRRLVPHQYDPDVDCDSCMGHGTRFDEIVNRSRSHYMRYATCETCKGTGKRHERQDAR